MSIAVCASAEDEAAEGFVAPSPAAPPMSGWPGGSWPSICSGLSGAAEEDAPEDAHHEIVPHPMRTENAERIRMGAGEEDVQLVHGDADYFEGEE